MSLSTSKTLLSTFPSTFADLRNGGSEAAIRCQGRDHALVFPKESSWIRCGYKAGVAMPDGSGAVVGCFVSLSSSSQLERSLRPSSSSRWVKFCTSPTCSMSSTGMWTVSSALATYCLNVGKCDPYFTSWKYSGSTAAVTLASTVVPGVYRSSALVGLVTQVFKCALCCLVGTQELAAFRSACPDR